MKPDVWGLEYGLADTWMPEPTLLVPAFGGEPQDYAQPVSNGSFNGNTGYTPGPRGWALDTLKSGAKATTNYINFGDPAKLDSLSEFIIAIGVTVKNTSTDNDHLLRKGGQTTSVSSFFILNDTSDNLWFRLILSGPTSYDVQRGSLPAGTHDILAYWDGSEINTFINGAVTGSAVSASGTINASGSLYAGNNPNTSGSADNGDFLVDYLYIWDRVFASPSLVAQSLSDDPFQIIRPRLIIPKGAFVLAAAKGAGNFTALGPHGYPMNPYASFAGKAAAGATGKGAGFLGSTGVGW